ncbi:hypothetical protein BO70DRAFT_361485 [Aspergillus heteromorphus CBS 117.55]|uniref:AB hydrolase-1 domain-containing protein n=1 Tax=Aspergillus heteromorphus CBS 117.55 TaxID=1448321 RepID=A0A317WEB8_9EURO|nr:uncharacterized protein BO70DRAFT_361485 [Aspergillus heteromorphus CBS 117.55]PWY83368.1 hypothetical protein BO70DRAFT_361485 [Aspergillus heteromorphus CBS 117.55]
MSQSKPSIILVTGSFCLPEFYDAVTTQVAAQGYDIHTLRLPSVGPNPGESTSHLPNPPTMYDDAAAIAREIAQRAEQGKEVIVVGHSYGGVPVAQSIEGLVKEGSGQIGGVIRLGYMTAVVPALGGSTLDVLGQVAPEKRGKVRLDENGWMWQDDLPAAGARCFSDLPPAQGLALIKLFPAHSAASFANPLTYAGYKDVPVSYLIC